MASFRFTYSDHALWENPFPTHPPTVHAHIRTLILSNSPPNPQTLPTHTHTQLEDSLREEKRRRNQVARRLEKVLLARNELTNKLDEGSRLLRELLTIINDADVEIPQKLTAGREYILRAVKRLNDIRKSEGSLREKIQNLAQQRETLKQNLRESREEKIGSLDIAKTRRALLRLKQDIRASGVLLAPSGDKDQPRSFSGSALLGWLVRSQVASDRAQALCIGHLLLEWGIVFDVSNLPAARMRDSRSSNYKFRSDASQESAATKSGYLMRVGRWRAPRLFWRWDSLTMNLGCYEDERAQVAREVYPVTHKTICRAVKFASGAEAAAHCFELLSPAGACLTLGAASFQDRAAWLQALWCAGCGMHRPGEGSLRRPRPTGARARAAFRPRERARPRGRAASCTD